MSHSKKRIIYLLIGIVILAILYGLKNTSYFIRASTFLFSILIFYFSNLIFKFNFKTYHYFIFILISALGILFSPLYSISPNYDKILHLISPILLSILIFYLVDRAKVDFSTKLLITFSIILMSLTLFEIGEFLLDKFFDLKLQGVFIRDYSGISKLKIIIDRNDDTMIDLISGTIGALIFTGYKSLENLVYKYKKKK